MTPFFREAGGGHGAHSGVVCLHSNASSSSQWRALMELLAPTFHVLAPDSYGAGTGPAWPTDRELALADEVALLEPVFKKAGDPFDLVGHSYGGAIALVAAATFPKRVRAVAVYEPTLFSLIEADRPQPNAADGIRETVRRGAEALDAGDTGLAAEHFIDFWMGKGSWARTPEPRKALIAESVRNMRGWAKCLMNEPTPLSAFSKLDIPVLYMTGAKSPASSLGVAKLLVKALPKVEVVEFDGVGHMGPITHADRVNEVIARFLGARR